jgi:hypothetical protein
VKILKYKNSVSSSLQLLLPSGGVYFLTIGKNHPIKPIPTLSKIRIYTSTATISS